MIQEYNLSLPAWFKEENPSINYKSNTRLRSLDPGEASSIALALEKKNCLLVVDELPARRIALEFNLRVAGPWAYYLKQKREN